ncbi:type IV pilus assembly protein PilM [Candidatus Kaiserbacteria bacterium]|nr:type IV pilus assembly protein PilM [Candidatus Kaiserbacteria bacterium]
MAFSLGSITEKISSAFGGGAEGSFLGIDIGTSSVKVVQMRASHGAAILETYGEIALGPYGGQPVGKAVKLTPEKTAEALMDLMKEANVTARSAGLSIPFSSSLISVLEFPKVDEGTLKRMVPIEARKYIPVPVSEVTLDWFVIPEDEEEKSAFDRVQAPAQKPRGVEVLLVAIHNDVVNSFQTVASTAGIHVEFYEIEIFGAIRSSLSRGIAPVLVVDIGASTTKMYIVERGIVRLTHLVSMGGQQMSETLARSLNWDFEKAERVKRERGLEDSPAYSADENDRIKSALLSTLSRLFSEVNRVLLSYGQRYNKNVSRVVLTGGGASLPGLSGEAKSSLSADVVIADPFARTEAPAFLADVLREIGPGFSVSAGLILRKLKST